MIFVILLFTVIGDSLSITDCNESYFQFTGQKASFETFSTSGFIEIVSDSPFRFLVNVTSVRQSTELVFYLSDEIVGSDQQTAFNLTSWATFWTVNVTSPGVLHGDDENGSDLQDFFKKDFTFGQQLGYLQFLVGEFDAETNTYSDFDGVKIRQNHTVLPSNSARSLDDKTIRFCPVCQPDEVDEGVLADTRAVVTFETCSDDWVERVCDEPVSIYLNKSYPYGSFLHYDACWLVQNGVRCTVFVHEFTFCKKFTLTLANSNVSVDVGVKPSLGKKFVLNVHLLQIYDNVVEPMRLSKDRADTSGALSLTSFLCWATMTFFISAAFV